MQCGCKAEAYKILVRQGWHHNTMVIAETTADGAGTVVQRLVQLDADSCLFKMRPVGQLAAPTPVTHPDSCPAAQDSR
jgi:hypothetical protein